MGNNAYVGVSSRRNLPGEYDQVNYIESTGMGYIDSGVKVSPNLRAEVDFQFIKIVYGIECTVFGTYGSTSRMGVLASDYGTIINRNGTLSQSSDIYARTQATAYPVTGYDSPSINITIFCQSLVSSVYAPFNGVCGTVRLYSLKFYDNNILIRDFVPAIRKSDSCPGLYDLANNVFYTEVQKIPSEYKRVEYIESTGEQYIDTGYKADANTGHYVKFSTTSALATSGHGSMFGAADNNWTTAYYLETYTTDSSHPGSFKYNSTSYDAKMATSTVLTICHSKTQNVLTRNDGSYISVANETHSTPVNMYIFASNKSGVGACIFIKAKLYHLIFLKSAGYVHEYYPVIRKSDNKPGLYDVATQTFLTNQGSGTDFSYGAEVTYGLTACDSLGTARKLKAGWVGVNGIARKIKAGWVGVNGVARKIFPDNNAWWLASSMAASDCICAYRFKGAGSESKALSDLTGHGYTLTKQYQIPENTAWNNDTGFYLGGANGTAYRIPHGLDNSSVSKGQIKSVVVRYKDGSNVASIAYSIFWKGEIAFWFGDRPTICQASNSVTPSSNYQTIGHNIGWNKNSNPSEIYKNGSAVAITSKSDNWDAKTYVQSLFGGSGYDQGVASVTIIGGAFYNRWLTAAEMATISSQLGAL